MSKINLQQKALQLRKLGKSYSEIKRELGVSKSTLSLWLRHLPLSKEQMYLLRDVSEVRIEKFRQTMLVKRNKRLKETYDVAKFKYLPLSKRELFIAGLFLYWGEGGKHTAQPLSLYNSNPSIVQFTLFWYKKILNIPKNRIKVRLHLYSDMDIKEEIEYWSKQLGLPLSQFRKPQIKKSKKADITYKGGFGHGTCGLIAGNVHLKEQVIETLHAISDFYRPKI